MRGLVYVVGILLFGTALAAGPVPIVSPGPNPEAPKQVQQYGQLQGSWSCVGTNLQPDGTWQSSGPAATWSWYYVLDGYAVQDVWKPAAGAVGTNLRTYDAEADKWYMVWATSAQARFDEFEATFDDGNIVMTGDRWARGSIPQHAARITFHNISKQRFDWKYESSPPVDAKTWTEMFRLSCARIAE